VFGFADVVVARWVMVVLGLGAIGYSLVTAYEWGLPGYRLLPMPWHLALDAASGVFLAASPWLLGFSEAVAVPHVVLGLLEVGAAALSSRRPGAAVAARLAKAGRDDAGHGGLTGPPGQRVRAAERRPRPRGDDPQATPDPGGTR
jgi:hypothetical protein